MADDIVAELRALASSDATESEECVYTDAADEIERLRAMLSHAPIVRMAVMADGQPGGITVYTPGLPPGDHDLYCEPVSPAVPASAVQARLAQAEGLIRDYVDGCDRPDGCPDCQRARAWLRAASPPPAYPYQQPGKVTSGSLTIPPPAPAAKPEPKPCKCPNGDYGEHLTGCAFLRMMHAETPPCPVCDSTADVQLVAMATTWLCRHCLHKWSAHQQSAVQSEGKP